MKIKNKFFSVVLVVVTLLMTSIYRIDAAAYVAEMRLFSSTQPLGHSWLLITNTSNSTLTVGKFPLPAGECVYVGTWGNLQWDGIWYNAEGYQKREGELSNHNSVKMNLTSANLNTITSKINSHYNTWSVLDNCSSFAVECWNAVSSTDLSAGIPNLPTHLAQNIPSVFPNTYSPNWNMPTKGDKETCYWNGTRLVYDTPNETGSSSFSYQDAEILIEQYDLELQ